MDFLQWAKGRKLPSFLQSRQGWVELYEYNRLEEPHLHQVEPTNACPYSCVMCPREEFMTRENGFMEFELFRKVIDEVDSFKTEARNKDIELFHFGESLLHPQFAEMIRYMSQKGLNSFLSLNPGHLTASLAEEILTAEPGKVILSIDGTSPETFRKIKGKNGDLVQAVANAEHFLDLHRQVNSASRVTLRMIVIDENKSESEEFRKYWEDRGAQVDLREFFPWNKKELQDLGSYTRFPEFMPCPFSWQYVVVQWNGDVVPCCRDYNGEMALGNVKESSLVEIWNGPAYADFRNRMASGENLHPLCTNCLEMYMT